MSSGDLLHGSNLNLREDADDWHLNIFVLTEMHLVCWAPEENGSERNKEQVERVMELAAHFPGRDLRWSSLGIEIICTIVKPVLIIVEVRRLKVTELV